MALFRRLLMKRCGIEHLAGLVNLDELFVGVYNLEYFDFLNLILDGIKSLSLAATKSNGTAIRRTCSISLLETVVPGGATARNRSSVRTLHRSKK